MLIFNINYPIEYMLILQFIQRPSFLKVRHNTPSLPS
ncbi:Unannotated [Lentimonas sp. CC10]|nr:Unannotated [Lentimonas sp. CC10]